MNDILEGRDSRDSLGWHDVREAQEGREHQAMLDAPETPDNRYVHDSAFRSDFQVCQDLSDMCETASRSWAPAANRVL